MCSHCCRPGFAPVVREPGTEQPWCARSKGSLSDVSLPPLILGLVKFPNMALFREKLFLQKAGVWKALKDLLREESQQGGRGASSQGPSSSVGSKNEEKTQVSPSPRETGALSTCERLEAKVFWPLAFPHSGVQASKGTQELNELIIFSYTGEIMPFIKVSPDLSKHNDVSHHLVFLPHLNPSCCSLSLWDRVMC